MHSRMVVSAMIVCAASACATVSGPSQKDVGDRITAATGATVRFEADAPSLPPGAQIDDGLTRDEAVAIALWNNAGFRAVLSQLGFARADLADAGMLANPALSLLFPVGPKQLEFTLRWPIELLWERPRRIAAATRSLDATAQTLVQAGLDFAQSVRLAHADLVLALDRQRLANEAAATLQRIDTLTQSRLAAGDIAELDARAARVDAVRAAQDAERAIHDVTIARARLQFFLGLPKIDRPLDPVEEPSAIACGATEDAVTRAIAARPDVRAAEIAVEAAAARLGWERSRIVTLTAVLDANGQGRDGFEAGPGIDVGIPLFNRNQGGTLRAQTDLQRAAASYVQVQQQVALEVREASAQFEQAHQSRLAWDDRIVLPLRTNLTDAEESFAAGESSYLFVLENSRRLIDARVRQREITADERRAQARLERAVGIGCQAMSGGVQ